MGLLSLLISPLTIPRAIVTGVASAVVTQSAGSVSEVAQESFFEPVAEYFTGEDQGGNKSKLIGAGAGLLVAGLALYTIKKATK